MIRFQSSRRSIAKPRRTGYLLSRVRAPFLERRGSSAPTLLTKILGLQFDRRTMRRAVGGVVPGIAVAMQGIGGGDALLGNQAFQRRQPVPVIGLAGVGITAGLRACNFVGERCRPFVPGEQAPLMQRQRHRKSLRFPGFAKYRAIIVAGNARHGISRMRRGGVHYAVSRYGSDTSMESFTRRAASGAHQSAPSNTTV